MLTTIWTWFSELSSDCDTEDELDSYLLHTSRSEPHSEHDHECRSPTTSSQKSLEKSIPLSRSQKRNFKMTTAAAQDPKQPKISGFFLPLSSHSHTPTKLKADTKHDVKFEPESTAAAFSVPRRSDAEHSGFVRERILTSTPDSSSTALLPSSAGPSRFADTGSSDVIPKASPKDASALLNILEKVPLPTMMKQIIRESVANNFKNVNKDRSAAKGARYLEQTKDIGSYLYLLGGRKDYEELVVNLGLPSVCTVQRHLRKSCDKIVEGKLRVSELVRFLETHGLSKVLFISEDGTKITSRIRYDIERDQIIGLCPDFNENGMPLVDSFSATSPDAIHQYLKKYQKSSIVYVILATPIAQKTLSFNLLSFGTNNKFSIEEVLLRWAVMEREMQKAGLTVLGFGADGDTRLIGSMKIRMGLPRSIDDRPCEIPALWKSWYAAQGRTTDIFIQDSTHIINKLKNSLLSSTRSLQIGEYVLICKSTLL